MNDSLTADDRQAIAACITNMSLFVDLHEWDNFLTLYEPRLIVDYTSHYGGEPLDMSSKEAMEMWARQVSWWDVTQHLITNIEIVGNGQEVVVRSNVRATHVKDDRPWTFAGLYTHRLRKQDGAWRIHYQTVERRYEENYEGDGSPKPAWLLAIAVQ